MFPLGVVGGLQEITSVKSSGEFACKSLTGPDTAEYVVKCQIVHLIQDDNSHNNNHHWYNFTKESNSQLFNR